MATKSRSNGGGAAVVLGPAPSADGTLLIETALPFIVSFTIEGVVPLLFHRWSNESVEAKASARKGSAAKKTDDVESYVARDEAGFICLPGQYVASSIASKKEGAAKYRQDPRSSRKSALDLYRAGVAPLTLFAPIVTPDNRKAKNWDYLDKQRVTVQGSGITRQRPAFNSGWKATFDFQVTLPEYIGPHDFLDVLTLAGRAVGVGDFRPTYGRFQVINFEINH